MGFFYSYDQQVNKTTEAFKEKYNHLTTIYADQISEIENSYEQLMLNSLYGIEQELLQGAPTKTRLVELAKKYGLTHLFLINKDGHFFQSTNEIPNKIPNLFTYSDDYKTLRDSPLSYLTTPIIIPFPEKTPHKFLTLWTGTYFIEVGIKVSEIAQNLQSIFKRDSNIIQAQLLIGETPFSVKQVRSLSAKPLIFFKEIKLQNPRFTQSLGDKSHWHSLSFKVSSKELTNEVKKIGNQYLSNFIMTLGLIILLGLVATIILRRTIQRVTAGIFNMANEENYQNNLKPLTNNQDFERLIEAINLLLKGYRRSSNENIRNERDLAYQSMARQVAHDIRSPLEALKASKEELSTIPEEDRRPIVAAISRIEEIAYNLLQYRRKSESPIDSAYTNIYCSIESIIIEKQMQYRDQKNLIIENSLNEESISAFVSIGSDTFKRVLSNLVNNSAEALNFTGHIEVSCHRDKDNIEVTVKDNGPGVSDTIKEQMTKKGFTTKPNGCGLGLSHAREQVELIGGRIKVSSNSLETKVTLVLPTSQTPTYWSTSINLEGISKVLILDDDSSIHEIWRKRFQNQMINIEYFHSAKSLLESYKEIPHGALLLSDYELLGEDLNGIECIKRLKARDRSILVTARAEEAAIISTVKEEGISLLSKTLARTVPIKAKATKDIDLVLIDNDELVHMTWIRVLKKQGINAETYFSIESFLSNSSSYHLELPIYIDSDLGDGKKGEILSEAISVKGFKNLYIATAYNASSIKKPTWIKEVLDKSPPDLKEI